MRDAVTDEVRRAIGRGAGGAQAWYTSEMAGAAGCERKPASEVGPGHR
jgi:hypothetical protein